MPLLRDPEKNCKYPEFNYSASLQLKRRKKRRLRKY
jgi:hypothetical protein